MACSVEFLTKNMEEIKIADDIFLGNYLSYEEKFLNSVIEDLGKKLKIEKFLFIYIENL